MTGLKQPGYRHNAKSAESVKGFKEAVTPCKIQMGQDLTLQRRKPISSPLRTSGPPARFDSSGEV